MSEGRQRRFGLLLATLAGAACGADEARGPTAEVVDSSGVRTVRYDLTDGEPGTLGRVGEHDLEIGVADGAPELSFSRIVDLAITDGGSLLVSDGVAREIRVFDADGVYQRTLGAGGDGPGEFSSAPTFAGLAGDTVFAFDGRASRVTAYTLSGELLGVTTYRSDDFGRPRTMLRQDDGSYLSVSGWVDPDARPESHEARLELDSIVVERIGARMEEVDTVLVVGDESRVEQTEILPDGMFRVRRMHPPFRPRAHVASDGRGLVVGRSDTFRISIRGPAGEPRTILRVDGVAHPATARDIRARQEALLRADLGDAEITPAILQANTEYLPDRLPAFGNLLVSDAGDLWVSLSELDDSAGLDWLVFTRTGELRGLVRTPPGLRLRAVGDGYVVGFVLDELDVPYVRRYRLIEGGGAAGADGRSSAPRVSRRRTEG